MTRRVLNAEWRDDHLPAAEALDFLRRYTTMTVLIAAYYDDRLDDAALDVLCRRPSERVLNLGDVEDAAHWRRALQLIAAAGGGPGRGGR